jgi:hypothetical protein
VPTGTGKSGVLYKEGLIDIQAGSSDKSGIVICGFSVSLFREAVPNTTARRFGTRSSLGGFGDGVLNQNGQSEGESLSSPLGLFDSEI